jgi:hypothetical protein
MARRTINFFIAVALTAAFIIMVAATFGFIDEMFG